MSEVVAADADPGSFLEQLKSFEGGAAGPPTEAPDPVNVPMIRHFVEAVGDENPIYLDDRAAAAHGHGGLVAPPAMLQAWTMRGLRRHLAAQRGALAPTPQDELFGLLARAGYASIVATNCEQRYLRELHPGDQLTALGEIESVSPEKLTALGPGHFLTLATRYADGAGELVATMTFRVLLYRPAQDRPAQDRPAQDRPAQDRPAQDRPAQGGLTEDGPVPAMERPGKTPGAGLRPGATAGARERGRRPPPILTRDNAFWFEALERGELLIQQCATCGMLRHPPRPGCAACGSLEWGTVAASRAGVLHSFVVAHHPQMPGFKYPLVIGLVELAEGTRLVAELRGVDPESVRIGQQLVARITRVEDSLVLPVFWPRGSAPPIVAAASGDPLAAASGDPLAAARAGQAAPSSPKQGDELTLPLPAQGDNLPPLEVPITRTLIVAGAIATRDYQDVHHDPDLAQGNGAPDIFMNILTTNGLVGRFVTDWAGPGATIESIVIRLGVPNYPGDLMRLTGTVTGIDGTGMTEVAVVGANRLGDHVTGTVRLRLPGVAR